MSIDLLYSAAATSSSVAFSLVANTSRGGIRQEEFFFFFCRMKRPTFAFQQKWLETAEKHEMDHPLQGAVHDGIRIHPQTKQTSFYVPNFWFEPEEESTPEFVEYIEYIKEQVYDPVNQERWIWNEGDFLIWDNRNLMHTMSGGWAVGERVFNRCSIGREKPIGVGRDLLLFQ